MCKRHYEAWLATAPPSEKVRRAVYPADDQIVAWFRVDHSISSVARRIGVARKTLDDYIARRPSLAEQVETLRTPPRLAPEEAQRRDKAAQADWRRRNPDRVRATNRRWAKNQEPEKRRHWNIYNRQRRAALTQPMTVEERAESEAFQKVIANDPCVYCGGQAVTVDHIRPINSAGVDLWENLAPACWSCNSQKNDKELLVYLLWRLDHVEPRPRGGDANPVDPDRR